MIELRKLQSRLEQHFRENNLQRSYNITEFRIELSNIMGDDFEIIKVKKVLCLCLADSVKCAASTAMINDTSPKLIETTK